ncbi:hypothetical protein AB0P21_03765 [Kribbella sp. NPDC056861]|uniref:hypothetical protein n=1 Tax=Kribbella sp. NPDC056861 TaxID=3154857 RepID=UPI003438D3EF
MLHWVRRTFLLITLGILGTGVLPAAAGGPTSVLLSSPHNGKVVAAGYQDPTYEELLALLSSQSSTDPEQHDVGNFVRATWLIHDMTPWRLDVIYPDAPGGPWIATTEDADGTGGLAAKPTWHRASNGARLTELLDTMGLRGNSTDGGTFGGPTTLPQPAPQTPAEVAAVDDTPTATTLRTEQKPLLGWRWSIPGFLLGAAVTYLFLRYVPRRRWQLIDEE